MVITLLLLQHHEEQQRAAARRAQLAAFPFTLSPAIGPTGHDVAIFTHLSARFTHALPGRTQLTPPLAAHGEPATDAVLWMYDLPVALRYRCEAAAFTAPSATDLAVEAARRFANWRSQREIEVKAVPDWYPTWRVDGAAQCRYDLAVPDSIGANREELVVLVRAGMVMHVTLRYPKGALDFVTHASMRSFVWGTMLWEPAGQNRSPWPQSTFLEPRVATTLSPGRHEQSAQLAARLGPMRPDPKMVDPVLLGMIEANGRSVVDPTDPTFEAAAPPWMPVPPEHLTIHRATLLEMMPHQELALFLDATLPQVRTAHDLRGVALMLGRALKS
jgi:hypothetical protein